MMRVRSLWMEVQQYARSEFMHALGLQLLAATSVLMIAALILMGVSLSNLKTSRVQGEALQDTLLEITTIETRLIDFDATWNNYRDTGNVWFMTRIAEDTDDLHGALTKLAQSLRNDPVQMQRHKDLAGLVAKRDVLNRSLYDPARHAGNAPSNLTREGRETTDAIRALLWDVLRSERQKRLTNTAAVIAQAQDSFRIAIGIVFLTFFFGGICLILSTAPRK